jgi:hypothetical protein
MEISRNEGSPKSSILIGFSLVNHPFWGTSIYGNPHIAPDAEKQEANLRTRHQA